MLSMRQWQVEKCQILKHRLKVGLWERGSVFDEANLTRDVCRIVKKPVSEAQQTDHIAL